MATPDLPPEFYRGLNFLGSPTVVTLTGTEPSPSGLTAGGVPVGPTTGGATGLTGTTPPAGESGAGGVAQGTGGTPSWLQALQMAGRGGELGRKVSNLFATPTVSGAAPPTSDIVEGGPEGQPIFDRPRASAPSPLFGGADNVPIDALGAGIEPGADLAGAAAGGFDPSRLGLGADVASAALAFLGPILQQAGVQSPELSKALQSAGLATSATSLGSNVAGALSSGAATGVGTVLAPVAGALIGNQLIDMLTDQNTIGELITAFTGGPGGLSKFQEGLTRNLATQETAGTETPFAARLGATGDYPSLLAALQAGQRGEPGVGMWNVIDPISGMGRDNPIQGYANLGMPGPGYQGAMLRMPDATTRGLGDSLEDAFGALLGGGQIVGQATTATGQNLPNDPVANMLTRRIGLLGGIERLGRDNPLAQPLLEALQGDIVGSASRIAQEEYSTDPAGSFSNMVAAGLAPWGVSPEQQQALMQPYLADWNPRQNPAWYAALFDPASQGQVGA